MACPKPTAPLIQAHLEGREDLLFDPILNMSANNAGSKQNDAFIYHGQERENIPYNVIHIRFHPFVKVILGKAFFRRELLMSVELCNGIEVVEEWAFQQCTSLHKISIPHSVRAIKDLAFSDCSKLTTAILNNGLKEIGEGAFIGCTSLVHITIDDLSLDRPDP